MDDALRFIPYAIALGQHRNFARTAEALHMSQPHLSRRIAALERSLGVPLFDRTRAGAIPTVFGRALIARGEAVMRSQATLRRELQLIAGIEVGTLVVRSGPFPSEISVATTVARVLQAYPRLAIEIRAGDADKVVPDLLAERVDVGVARVTGLGRDERLVVEALPPIRAYVACRPGHPLARERAPSFARVMDFPLATNVLRGAPAAAALSRDGTVLDAGAGTPDFIPQIVVNSPAMARLIARDSDALVLGTARQLADDVAAGHLVRLAIDAPVLRTVHGILYLRDRTLSPAARVFIDTLRAVEAEIRRADMPVESPAKPRPKPTRRK